MPKGLIFFCCACCILLLTIINLSIGPIISEKTEIRGNKNCAILKDEYDRDKESNPSMPDETKKYYHEWRITRCEREKAFYNMEYTAFVFDVVIGFICSLIGLLHYFGIINKSEIIEKVGIIGLCCGAIGFVLTFVYIIFNGIVYTNYYDDHNIYKTDKEGAFAKKIGQDKYECMYFDKKGNVHALYAKYSDLINKQYNYNRDLQNEYQYDKAKSVCYDDPLNCLGDGTIQDTHKYFDKNNDPVDCDYLYTRYTTNEITNKDKSDRFLTTLILGLIVCLANVGLAVFSLLIAKSGEF